MGVLRVGGGGGGGGGGGDGGGQEGGGWVGRGIGFHMCLVLALLRTLAVAPSRPGSGMSIS